MIILTTGNFYLTFKALLYIQKKKNFFFWFHFQRCGPYCNNEVEKVKGIYYK